MKEYERYILWLDYFNSGLKRAEGRRVPLSASTRDPTLGELEEACTRLNMQPSPTPARYPSGPLRNSGYVSVRKAPPKQAVVIKVARELSGVRGRAAARQKSGDRKKTEKSAKP